MPVTIRRALISVSDKSGVVEFAKALADRGVEILSTGGTARLLTEQGIAVKEVAQHTGFPEIMDGRVKTLHPKIHGGLLGRRGVDESVMALHGIDRIDLLAVNLYPFAETVARPACTYSEAIENIDIGGPAMVRAASKNHDAVTVLVDPQDYAAVLEALAANEGATTPELRAWLAAKAFAHTARYDSMVASYLQSRSPAPGAVFPQSLPLVYEKVQDLRYGENPHQKAAFYRDVTPRAASVASSILLQGKELSFNNIADADTAIECVRQFSTPACVIVKHANPCGVAIGADILAAYNRAYQTDPTSAFGGVLIANGKIDTTTAKEINSLFCEVVIAPAFDEEAVAILSEKKNRIILVQHDVELPNSQVRTCLNGLLVQDRNNITDEKDHLKVVTNSAPTAQEIDDLIFASKICKNTKSNTIVFAKNSTLVASGTGQTSRVDALKQAIEKATTFGFDLNGAVMASDAFFPFPDCVEIAHNAGVTAVIQPGGSIKDELSINFCNENKVAMVFTGTRHFKH